ncbi:MAG: 30S ribosome-binding factor RbfA [Bdellovibrionia bacterium]
MKNTGDGRRVTKVEKEVQSVVAQYLISGFRFPLPGLVTVSRVQMPPDLRLARVFINIYGSDQDKSEAIELLNKHRKDVQSAIAKKLAIRYTPVLEFFLDEGPEHMMRINELLKQIKKDTPPSEE